MLTQNNSENEPQNDSLLAEKKDVSQATEIVSFVKERAVLFHNRNKDVFAQDKISGEVRQITSRQFRDWLTSAFFEKVRKVARDQALREALSTLSGVGRHLGELDDVNVRVAKDDRSYFIDLCQQDNSRAIRILPGRWEIIDTLPVKFIRPESMQALPNPIKDVGIDLSSLWQICNVPDALKPLVIAYICEMLRHDTPYPLLEILGEQGSAKSTTQAAIRRIIDPNTCDLRAAPKCPEDLFVAANVNHIVSYENISHLSPQAQDACCVISTGGGYAKRKLYSDADETIIHAKNPIMINGVTPIVTAQDLIDRTITAELPIITQRCELTSLWSQFTKNYARILGAVLNIFTKALERLPNVELAVDKRPRLIEFARLGIAVAEVMGLSGEDFLLQFTKSRHEAIIRTIDANPVASALMEWFGNNSKVSTELSAKELYEKVQIFRMHGTDAWPRSPKGFADALRRAAPALRQLGIDCVCLGKRGSYVMWRISPK